MRPFVGTAIIALLVGGPALAQWDPGATADFGMGLGQTALGQSTLDGTRKLGQADGKDSQAGEPSPTMRAYCAKWPQEGVCRSLGLTKP